MCRLLTSPSAYVRTQTNKRRVVYMKHVVRKPAYCDTVEVSVCVSSPSSNMPSDLTRLFRTDDRIRIDRRSVFDDVCIRSNDVTQSVVSRDDYAAIFGRL